MKQMARTIGLATLCLTVSACTRLGTDDEPEAPPEMPTPEEIARADYARIAEEANVLISTDFLGYREGETTPHRVDVECRADICAIGFSVFLRAGLFSVEGVDLELQQGLNGVRRVVGRRSNEHADVHALGGWMEHSFFTSQVTLWTNETDPDQGSIRVGAHVVGVSTEANPTVLEGGATWLGFVVGRDTSVTDDMEASVEGEASIFVEVDPMNGMEADVAFSRLFNRQTGEHHPDISWNDLAVSNGGFSRFDAVDDRITGEFFGPEQEEVAGTFERAGIVGAFGGQREQ